MEDCIFCKIIAGKIDTKFVYKDDVAVAFNDIHPLAPVHVLVVPIEHIDSLTDIGQTRDGMMGRLLRACNEVAKINGIAERGFRVVINSGPEGGQVVPHLHLHVLGGKSLKGGGAK